MLGKATITAFVATAHPARSRRFYLVQRGVSCERYAHLEQDDVGVWLAPSGAKVAWFQDPDGNLLSLTESGVARR